MTPPENDLRDAVADILLQELIVRRRYDSVGRAADWIDGKDIAVDRILSGPLAKARTDLERVTAGRDAENTREFAARGQEPGNVWDFVRHVEEQCRTFIRERNEWKAVADTAEAENTRLRALLVDAGEALKNVRGLISEAAMTGFNHEDGDWPERLFHSQQMTSHTLAALSPNPKDSTHG